MDKDNGQQQENPSRIIVEFAGRDSATITGFQFINITMGQVLVLAEWATLQADIIKATLARQQRPNDDTPRIIVPNLHIR